MNIVSRLLVATLISLSAASCQKVIDVKLNSAARKYVIEGEVNNGPGPYLITISQTRDFGEDNNFDEVSGALVRIADETAGVVDTLRESSPGTYVSSTLAGVPGHSYRLTVLAGGQTFTALASMPAQAVQIDSLYVKRSEFGGDFVFITPEFTDPVGVGNYYRIRQWVNDTAIDGSRLRNDDATDGQTFRAPLYYNADEESGNPKIRNGSNIAVELQCLNKEVFDYYRTLGDVTGENSATPANPLSNITGGALGIFNTCTTHKKQGVAAF
jgi:hypothetical protein